MTYNFDPDKWYENELATLKSKYESGKLTKVEFDKAIELKEDYTQADMNRRRTMMALKQYKPVEGSRLRRWHKAVILGGVTAVIALVSALIILSVS